MTRTEGINDDDESPEPANEVPELTPSEAESLMNETRIGKSSRRQLRVYKKLLRKGRISGRSKHFEHMDNFYKVAVLRFHPILLCIVQSEERMHGRGDKRQKEFMGRHSSKLYENIVNAFEFDEFHRPVFREKTSKADLVKQLQEEQEAKDEEESLLFYNVIEDFSYDKFPRY